MALKRFMLYAENPAVEGAEVVYCWGFRASLRVASRMSEWFDGARIVIQDLDTAEEVRWFPAAEAELFRNRPPGPGRFPIEGGWIAVPPLPQPLLSGPRLAEAPGEGAARGARGTCLRSEVDLHHALTARSRLAWQHPAQDAA